jgi:hypothetical protein
VAFDPAEHGAPAPEALGLGEHGAAVPRTRIILVSAQAWRLERSKVEAIVGAPQDDDGPRFLLLDFAAVARVTPSSPGAPAPFRVIDMACWLRQSAQRYRPDEAAVSADLGQVSNAEILVIDGAAFDFEAMREVLNHMRTVLFAAPAWPRAIVFILRDELLGVAMEVIPAAFYLMPRHRSLREATAFAMNLQRAARLAMWLNLSHQSTGRFFSARTRFANFIRRLHVRDEERRLR